MLASAGTSMLSRKRSQSASLSQRVTMRQPSAVGPAMRILHPAGGEPSGYSLFVRATSCSAVTPVASPTTKIATSTPPPSYVRTGPSLVRPSLPGSRQTEYRPVVHNLEDRALRSCGSPVVAKCRCSITSGDDAGGAKSVDACRVVTDVVQDRISVLARSGRRLRCSARVTGHSYRLGRHTERALPVRPLDVDEHVARDELGVVRELRYPVHRRIRQVVLDEKLRPIPACPGAEDLLQRTEMHCVALGVEGVERLDVGVDPLEQILAAEFPTELSPELRFDHRDEDVFAVFSL